MNDAPLISIVTVTYNAANEIIPTMKSVGEQTEKDFEHIIIDGASKDNTLEIVRKYASPSLRILSEPDKGLYDAMNKGLKIAKGKYLLFLNAGDAFHSKDILKKYADEARKNQNIIYADTVIVDKDRKVLGPRHLSAPEVLTYDSFAKGMLVCHQAFMVRREIAPSYNLRYPYCADYFWTLCCLMNSNDKKNVNLNTVAIDYLSDGISDKHKWASLKDRFKVMVNGYGWPKTIFNHIGFVFRAIKRGKI